MRTGGTLNELDKKLNDIIIHNREFCNENGDIDIRVSDMNAYSLNEDGLSTALSRAYQRKELDVLYRIAIEDLIPDDSVQDSPVIATVRLLNQTSVTPPKDSKRIGDFAYKSDATLGAELYWKERKLELGPKADKLVAFLLENNSTWKSGMNIAQYTGGVVKGVSEMVGTVNKKVNQLTRGEVKKLVESDGAGKYRINI